MVQLLEKSREETPATGSAWRHVFTYATNPFDRDSGRKRWTAQRVTGYTIFNIFIGGLLVTAAVVGVTFLCISAFASSGVSSASASLDGFAPPTTDPPPIVTVPQDSPAATLFAPAPVVLPLQRGFRWMPRRHLPDVIEPADNFPVSVPNVGPPAASPVVNVPAASPSTTAPTATTSPATDPSTTTPPTTRPPVTIPPTTLPPVTIPPTTAPPVTDPPTTDPPVTLPPITLPSIP